jgi:HAE1 family hydrophobic/amphiphilic exporter-1
VVFFGMAFATLVTLIIIPAMYRLISVKTHSPGYIASILEDAISSDSQRKVSRK